MSRFNFVQAGSGGPADIMAVLYHCSPAINSCQMVLGQTELKLENGVGPGPQSKEPKEKRPVHEGCKADAPVVRPTKKTDTVFY